METRNFIILEEINNLPSSLELVKVINKYAPRAISNEYILFIRQLVHNMPESFYTKNKVTVCSTNSLAYINFFKEKFNASTWNDTEFIARFNRKSSNIKLYYYIDNDNLVVLLYAESFYLKKQALPYSVL